jgi:hypothetical protein
MKKPKRPAASISQPTRAIQVEHGEATSMAMLDGGLVLQAEKASKAAERGQKGKPAFFGAGAGDKPKSRNSLNDDGDVTLRKKAAQTMAGHKRKRGDVLETPNKRSADVVSLKTRRSAPVSSAMEIDPVSAAFLFTV